MSKRRRDSGAVPERWLHCPRRSVELIADKFLAFKTPLNEEFDDKVPQECRFPPRMLFDVCRAKKIKIGMWIDLTNTKRFYDKHEIERYGCKYVKLQCRGHGETPSVEQTQLFITVVQGFIAHFPLEVVAVHCTHGFNRTGFLITSYLVTEMDMDINMALLVFAKARSPGIYKEDYINELYKRYGDDMQAPPPPTLPDWCLEEEDDNDEVERDSKPISNTSSSRDATRLPPRKRMRKTNAVFMEGVPGIEVFTKEPDVYELQRKVQAMCKWAGKDFPGCQPVSMDWNNMEKLHNKSYRVSWKADGTRYMMLINGVNQVYFFDRDFNVFHVQGLWFPQRKDPHRHLTNTLLDGEMVIDKVDGKDIPRYLAYDMIYFEDEAVRQMPFYPHRMGFIQNEVINPRIAAMEKGIINRAAEPFSVRKKEFWHVTQAASLLGEKFAKTLSHEPDGLVFQPSKDPYVSGQCPDVLKWKPAELNSVDFRLKIAVQSGQGIIAKKIGHLCVGRENVALGKIKLTKDIRDLNNKIIECRLEQNEWKFMRERTDKSFPNSYDTAMAVMGSIQQPVTKVMLLDFIAKYRYNDDHEMMPPPPPNRTSAIRR